MAGRPPGSENKNKKFRAAIERLIDADPRRLDQIADRVFYKAAEGDMTACTIIRDTLDGKPHQTLSGEDGGPLQFERIERVIVSGSNVVGMVVEGTVTGNTIVPAIEEKEES
jgi:hypothetical protein